MSQLQQVIAGQAFFPRMGHGHNHQPNLRAVYRPLDGIRNLNAVLTPDEYLFFEVRPFEVWSVSVHFTITSESANGDFQGNFSVPAGSTYHYINAHNLTWSSVTDHTTLILIDFTGAGAASLDLVGVLKVGAVGGKFSFDWAQQVSHADDQIIKAGAKMLLTRLA